jgi:hypothetical protein
MKESYHHADHTIVAEIGLHGPFYQVPDWLYFRRDHPDRAERACPTMRSRCVNMDPRRASRLRHPAVRLYGEYVWGYIAAIRRAPLSPADRRECYSYLAQWFASRARPGRGPESNRLPLPYRSSQLTPSWLAGRKGLVIGTPRPCRARHPRVHRWPGPVAVLIPGARAEARAIVRPYGTWWMSGPGHRWIAVTLFHQGVPAWPARPPLNRAAITGQGLSPAGRQAMEPGCASSTGCRPNRTRCAAQLAMLSCRHPGGARGPPTSADGLATLSVASKLAASATTPCAISEASPGLRRLSSPSRRRRAPVLMTCG